MPPILMTVGEKEMLLNDTLTVAQKIEEGGSDIELIIGKNMFHAYPLFYGYPPLQKQPLKKFFHFYTSIHALNLLLIFLAFPKSGYKV